jgi:hypothetical protein
MRNGHNLIASETTGLCQIRTKNKCIHHVKCHSVALLIVLDDFLLLPLAFGLCVCLCLASETE